MLKGDLSSTPLAPLLLDLADDQATGCLDITESGGEEALVFYKSGLVYAVSVPGTRPQLGAKLVSSGALAPEALAEALEAQRSELQGWRLGELLVHLGYVDQPVVEAFVKEQVSEALWDLMRWTDGQWRFRKNIKAREDVGPPMVVVQLLETLRDRGYEWETISAVVHGPAAIPVLSTRGDGSAETTLDNDAWSMLCKIDGERSVADLASDCGYTLFEAGHVIVSLVQAGLVDIDEDIDVPGDQLYGATTLTSALAGELDDDGSPEIAAAPDGVEEDAMSKLARLVTEVSSDHLLEGGAATEPVAAESAVALAAPQPARNSQYANPMLVPLHRQSNESFAASMALVSRALAEVLGDAPEDNETAEDLQRRQAARRRSANAASLTDDPEWQRRKRLRTAAAAELATAAELVATTRPEVDADVPEYTGEIPKVVSTETERRRAAERAAEQAERHAAEQEARAAAEVFAKAAVEEAERHAAKQEAQRVAAEQAAQQVEAEAAAKAAAEQEAALGAQEAARLQEERDAAEENAWADYWHREEAERQAAEEAERFAAEAVEQLAAEHEAAELAAEQERLIAEAVAEQERQDAAEAQQAERAAEREAEKLAAEEAERREDQAAAATALLVEIAATADDAPAVDEADPTATAESAAAEPVVVEAVAADADDVKAEDEDAEPVAVEDWSDAGMADTAALLRELSSLGVDDAPPTNGAQPVTRSPRATVDKKVKKKIGLFGL